METVYGWVRSIIFCLCLLELLCHLVRGEEYRRYIRFFGGLVILLLVLAPLGKIFSFGTTFEDSLRLAFAREEAYELQVSREALAGLQSRRIMEAYEEELKRQITGIAQAHGQQCSAVQIALADEEEQYAIEEISLLLMPQNRNLNVFEEDAQQRQAQQEAAEAIRAEICTLYGVERAKVHVSAKEQD